MQKAPKSYNWAKQKGKNSNKNLGSYHTQNCKEEYGYPKR